LEFILDNKDNRLVKNMFFYDVKTFYGKEKKVEASLACFKQFNILKKLGFECFNYVIILKNNWRFDYYIKNYNFNSIKVYSRFKV
jgi:hypothetical protein